MGLRGNIGALRRAADLVQLPVGMTVRCEEDIQAVKVYRSHWRVDVYWPDITLLSRCQLIQFVSELAHVRMMVVGCRICPSMAKGPKAAALIQTLQILEQGCRDRDFPFWGVLQWDASLRCPPVELPDLTTPPFEHWSQYELNSQGFSRLATSSIFLTSSPLELEPGSKFVHRSQQVSIVAREPKEPNSAWLSEPWEWPAVEQYHHTHVCPLMVSPAGALVHSLSCVQAGSEIRQLSASEHEVLLGFGRAHTRSVLKQLWARKEKTPG